MSSPTPTVVPLYASTSHGPEAWGFRGTAFFINATMLLTARHVVDGPNHYDEHAGTLTFSGEDNKTRWAIGLDRGKDQPPRLLVEVVARHPHHQMDVALLEVREPLPSEPRPVIWLEQITRADWNERTSAPVEFGVEAFPQTYTLPEIGAGAPAQGAVETVVNLDNPKLQAPGLLNGKMAHGGVHAGESGGPLFLRSAFGSFCLGVVKLGGENSGTGTFLGEGSILPWLRQRPVQFHSFSPRDLPPEDLADYLQALRKRTRTLLVPILGRAAADESRATQAVNPVNPAEAWRLEHSEEEFIRLFICLHARPHRGEAKRTLRAGAVEELYEEVRATWKARLSIDLRPFAEAAQVRDDDSGRVLCVVERALEHVISTADGTDRPREPGTTGLKDWEPNLLLSCCDYLTTRVAAGERQLEHRDHVWNALQSAAQVVLASPAGGGKSTVAMFLALALAKPCADHHEPKLTALRDSATDLRRRLPVFVRLREFRDREFKAPPAKSQAHAIEELIDGHLEVETARRVKKQCAAGKAFVILDGLDELDGGDRQRMFCQCLEAWLAQNRGNAVLVTTRPTAYPPAHPETAERSWRLKEFGLWHLEKLHPTQQREFLESWFETRDSNPAETAREVLAEIRERQLTDLSEDPLLLAGLARLAADRRHQPVPKPLPDTKVEVFDETVQMMLTTWEAVRSNQPHSRLEVDLCHWRLSPDELREILAGLALLSLVPSGQGDFSRETLEKELTARIQTLPVAAGDPKDGAQKLVEVLSEQSGLVRPLETGLAHKRVSMLEFPVRSYRNYLAGEALFQRLPEAALPEAKAAFQAGPAAFGAFCIEQGLGPILGLAPGDPPVDAIHEEQTLDLALARQVILAEEPIGSFLDRFSERILQRQNAGQSAFRLIRAAVKLALDVKAWRPDLSPGPQRLITGESGNIPRWRELLSHAMHSAVEIPADRATAASLLGLLSAAPDFSRPLAVHWRPVGADGRLRFRRGDDAAWGGGGASTCDLVRHAFYMGAYPVTVDEYEVFVRTTSAPRPAAFEGKLRLARTGVFRTPNHPVVGVSFAEAKSYCDWLTGEMREGRLSVPVEVEVEEHRAAWEIRLPEEWEWEFAARGPEEDEPSRPAGDGEWFRVPWGWATAGEIRALSNCDWQLKGTCAVTLLDGTGTAGGNLSPFKIADLVGNVWEWCQTPYVAVGEGEYPADYVERIQEAQKDPGLPRVVRGGSWNNAPADCRCADRGAGHPGGRFLYLGFRLVLAPVPPGASGARVV